MSMKKRLGLASVAAVLSLSLAVGAGAVAADRSVEGDASRIVQWAQSSEWVDEGLAIYAGQWAGGGFRMFFNVADGGEFSMKFKVPVYENDSENYLSENGNMYSKYILDVIVESYTNSGKAVLRLWGDSGKAVNSTNVSARITSGDLHDKTAESNPNEVAEGIWVKGAMRENNEFYVAFNTEDFFKGYWGDWDTTGPLLTVSGSVKNGQDVKNTLDATFNPEGNECETVQVYFRLSAQHTEEFDEDESACPEHAPNAMSKVIVTEVNGQSLANEGGVLQDTGAPYVVPVKLKSNAEIYMGREYAVEIKGSPRESATQPLYCDYASDVLCYERLSYKVNVTAPSGAERTFDGLENIVFSETGKNKISVTATDLAGNSYTSAETEVDVVRGFVLNVSGVPETGKVGGKITLPAGSATDSLGNECAVKIEVEDPYTKDIVLTDNSFTPDKTGVYIVTYSSQNEDGTQSDKKTFRITVSESSGGRGGCGCSGSVAGVLPVGLAAGAAAVIGLILKKKKEDRT